MTTHNASFWEAVKGAVQSLRSSKLRSFLTLLGIILATTTLIAVMSVISGMDRVIADNVSGMGADGYTVVRIFFTQRDPKKFLELLRRNPQLSREEFDFLRSRVTLTRDRPPGRPQRHHPCRQRDFGGRGAQWRIPEHGRHLQL